MKVKEIRFRPLARPPKKGEWFRWGKRGTISDACGLFPDIDYSSAEAMECTEVEVDVEDPVPEWIVNALAPLPYEHLKNAASAFRAHVEERAKAAAEKWYSPQFYNAESHSPERLERIIHEELLK